MPHPDLKNRAVADFQAAANLHREQQALEESAKNDSRHHGRVLEVAGESASASQFEPEKRRSSASSEGELAYATHPNKKLRLTAMPDVPALDNKVSVIRHAPIVVRNQLSISAESVPSSACSSVAESSGSQTPIVSHVAREMTPVQESTQTLEVLFDGYANDRHVRLIDEVWKNLELDIKNNPGCKERIRRMENRGGPYRLMINGSVCVPMLSTKCVPTIHLVFGRNADYIQTLIIEVTRLDGSIDKSQEHTFPVADEAALKKRILFQATVEAKKFAEDPEYFRGSRILREGCTTTYSLCKKIAGSLSSPMTAKELGSRMGILDPILNQWMGYASMRTGPMRSVNFRNNASRLIGLFPQPQ